MLTKRLFNRNLIVGLVGVIVVGAVGVGSVHAANVKLNGTLPDDQMVSQFRFSSDSSYVVYGIGWDEWNSYSLYKTSISGASPATNIVDMTETDADWIITFDISTNGNVVYSARKTGSGIITDLYSVSTAGSASPIRLNPTQTSGNAGDRYTIIGDGTRIAYEASDAVNGTNIYSSTIGVSGSSLMLSDPATIGARMWFTTSSDGSTMSYVAETGSYNNIYELYSRSTDGSGSVVKLNDTLLPDYYVKARPPLISPDSSRIVYAMGESGVGIKQIFSRSIDGTGSNVQLNEPESDYELIPAYSSIQISPDGNYVLYTSRPDTSTGQKASLQRTD